MDIIIVILFSYISGSIPFGLILTKIFFNKDVRKIGSGNIGATNVLRTGNKFLAVATLIFDVLKGLDAQDQIEIDHTMTLLDGQSNKGRLGANALLGVSLANAKAAASELELPLYRYLGGVSARILPVPMINIINGGVHADNCIAIQEFMIMPISVANITEAIRCGAEIFRCLKIELAKVGLNTSVGDEGGFAPNLKSAEETFEFILKAIKTAGYEPEKDVVLALDAASSEFYKNGKYELVGENKSYNSEQMVSYYSDFIKKFPIFSIEDG